MTHGPTPLQRHRFDAMGTWVECLVEAAPSGTVSAALLAVEREFARLEAKLSRFRPDSELSRLNRARSTTVSDELHELVHLALEARERTGGRFDPTLHDALVAAGYDRTFSELRGTSPLPVRHSGGGPVRVVGRTIHLGPGASLDLGGIAKGWAADRCVAMLAEHGPALVNAGGDLAVSGPRASGGWPVGVDVPGHRLTLSIASGGLATSGRDRRRWHRDGEERHHLIDPRTLRPATSAPLSVTVTAPTATEAEIRAKDLFLGADPVSTGTPAVIVRATGEIQMIGIGGLDAMEAAA